MGPHSGWGAYSICWGPMLLLGYSIWGRAPEHVYYVEVDSFVTLQLSCLQLNATNRCAEGCFTDGICVVRDERSRAAVMSVSSSEGLS